ncbi:MAG TPA: methylmalonyl-CoA mutase family protein, partial [Actinoplanes sp.]|nr:methylmalonyl-CoA mutase family protein [Actinoplanes sp.]
GAVAGGTQSLHTNAYDEALALPTEKSARLALRTQQVIAYESGMTGTVDPFAGSYAIEAMTDEVERVATGLIEQVFAYGSAVEAIEQGFQKEQIEASAYRIANQIDSGERVVVGVNRFGADEEEAYQPLRADPAIEANQAARLAALRAERDGAAVEAALADLAKAAQGTDNVLPLMREALRLRATVGEVCHTLRGVWGVYHPVERF